MKKEERLAEVRKILERENIPEKSIEIIMETFVQHEETLEKLAKR